MSSCLAQTGPPRMGCSGPYPDFVFNIFKDEGDSLNFLGNLDQCSVSLTVQKTVSWCSDEISCFSLCPLPLGLPLCTTGKSLPMPFLYIQVFICSNKCMKLPSLPLHTYIYKYKSLPFPRLHHPSSLSFSSHERSSSPLFDLALAIGKQLQLSFVLGTQKWALFQVQPHLCEERGGITSVDLLPRFLLCIPG